MNPSSTPADDLRIRQRRAFTMHATIYTATTLILIAVNLMVNLSAGTAGQFNAWWSLWALVGWGAGIVVHGMVVRLASLQATE